LKKQRSNASAGANGLDWPILASQANFGQSKNCNTFLAIFERAPQAEIKIQTPAGFTGHPRTVMTAVYRHPRVLYFTFGVEKNWVAKIGQSTKSLGI
jgi:hypothetical protein